MADQTEKSRVQRRLAALSTECSSWKGHWKDLSTNILPRKSRFLVSERNDGRKKTNHIIDNTGTIAARTLASGMMAGITSPARPWFKLVTPDPDLQDYQQVKMWLAQVEQVLRTIFQRSNTYQALHSLYSEHGTFGTGNMLVLEDFQDVIRCHPFTVGSYMLGIDERGDVTTLYREIEMTVEQVVRQFGLETLRTETKDKWDRGDYDKTLGVYHAIEPNHELDPRAKDFRGKAFRSYWWEKGSSENEWVQRSGFHERPFMAPRWEVTGFDVYGSSCPGMIALGDVKQLQQQQRKKAVGIERIVDPPLQAPSSLRDAPGGVVTTPSGITYVDGLLGSSQGVRPLYEVDLRLGEMTLDIGEVQQRVNTAYYADLFLMLAQSDRRQMTATEVAERHEEKLLMLGPMLERIQDELLDPLIDRTFAIALRADIFPPPPPELQGVDLKVQYISLLAQAQQAVGISAMERTLGFAGNLAGSDPTILDNIDLDEAVHTYADLGGAPPKIMRDSAARDQIRTQRAQQQQMAAQAEMTQQAAQGAKLLSETDTEGRNALTDILGG